MTKASAKLSARTVATLSEPGLYGDGNGLWLQISRWGTKSWIFRFTMNGKTRDMGLGPLHTVGLADARKAAEACRIQVRDGIDPIERRKAARLARMASEAKILTFKEVAESYIKAHEASWKNVKHAWQWSRTLEQFVYPVFGALSVAAVDTGLVLKVLEPIWTSKTETATRIRGRIEVILDYATARKYRRGENPAKWKGHLDAILPAPGKIQHVKHHAALPYDRMPAFMKELRAQDGVAARGLEFAILTAARTGEVIGATWEEIDLEKRVWAIPPERMKMGKEHRVPLSDAAISVLNAMAKVRSSPYVFPGWKGNGPLSNMAFLNRLKRMKHGDLTAHGFRSTFRDWAAEQTRFPAEVAEMALAHAVGNKVEAAYRRGDLFEKRQGIMAAWASFCAGGKT